MKPHVTVTVGMCVKNAEATVKEALESVIDQDFPHEFTELIVVDGSSKDKTLSIVTDYLGKTDIKSRSFRENSGLGLARQIVVDNASGDYVVWVDGDMELSRDFVGRQVEFMETNPNVGIAKGRYGLLPGANLLATLEIYSRASDKMRNYNLEKTVTKSLGTSGCIYRVKALRQSGGFDKNIKGYGEDWDAEYRIRLAGWKLCTTQVQYRDYERFGITWKELWRRYWQRGHDLYDVLQKHRGVIKLYGMLPPAVLFSGIFKSLTLYKLTQRKIVFLMPLQNMLKMVAWWIGFIEAGLGNISNSGQTIQ
jgi:glycosyltransferase involved in cell wall biosynthesis